MSKILDLQTAIATRLAVEDAAVPLPAPANNQPVQWLTEIIGDLASVIARNLSKLGISGIVLTPQGKLITENVQTSIPLRPMIEIQIQENVVINRGSAGTQIAALDLVEFCMKRLNGWSPSNQRITRMDLDETPYLLVAETPTLVYNVRLHATVTLTK